MYLEEVLPLVPLVRKPSGTCPPAGNIATRQHESRRKVKDGEDERSPSTCPGLTVAGDETNGGTRMTTETMQIKVVGELSKVPDIAGIIQASVQMYEGTGHEGYGDLFFEGLHVSWSCSSHERIVKLPKRAKKAA
jgi:hypothetical protein